MTELEFESLSLIKHDKFKELYPNAVYSYALNAYFNFGKDVEHWLVIEKGVTEWTLGKKKKLAASAQ